MTWDRKALRRQAVYEVEIEPFKLKVAFAQVDDRVEMSISGLAGNDVVSLETSHPHLLNVLFNQLAGVSSHFVEEREQVRIPKRL